MQCLRAWLLQQAYLLLIKAELCCKTETWCDATSLPTPHPGNLAQQLCISVSPQGLLIQTQPGVWLSVTRQDTDVRTLQVLEGLLDDDADMADMYLARRAQLAASTAATASQHRAGMDTGPTAHQTSGVQPLCLSLPV